MTDDDFDAPMERPKRRPLPQPPAVMPPFEPATYRPVCPGEFLCADHKAPDGFWSTPSGWIALEPNTPVDEAFAYAVVHIVGSRMGRFVMAHPSYAVLEDWCRKKVSGDWTRTYEIRPCNLLVIRQPAPRPPAT